MCGSTERTRSCRESPAVQARFDCSRSFYAGDERTRRGPRIEAANALGSIDHVYLICEPLIGSANPYGRDFCAGFKITARRDPGEYSQVTARSESGLDFS